MSQLDLQRHLVNLVSGNSNPLHQVERATLLNEEQAWLRVVEDSPGLKVSQQTQKWWRTARLLTAAPLTMRLLKRFKLDYLAERYQRQCVCRSMFFEAEVSTFKEFLEQQNLPNKTIAELVLFECELRIAHRFGHSREDRRVDTTKIRSDVLLQLQDNTVVIETSVSFSSLLRALIQNTALPDEVSSGKYYVVVSPHLPSWWRECSELEGRLLKLCSESKLTLRQLTAISGNTVYKLLNENLLSWRSEV